MKKPYLLLVILLCCAKLYAQTTPHLVQFSGVVLGSDTRRYASFVSIVNPKNYRGTVSDYQGYFSFVATPGDTFVFSAIGYKKQLVSLPVEAQNKDSYSKNIILERDTFELPLINIYPWPDVESFKRDFLTRNIPDDDLVTAKKNLKRESLIALGRNQAFDGAQNARLYYQRQAQQLYYQGQYAPNQLLNPLAWAQFFQMVKEGRISFKIDKDDQ